jgi:hypothetical protein
VKNRVRTARSTSNAAKSPPCLPVVWASASHELLGYRCIGGEERPARARRAPMLCRRRGAGTTDRPQRTRHHPGAEGDGGRPDRVRARGLGRNRRARLCAEVREQPRQEGRSLLAGEGRRAPEPPSDRWSRRRPRRATRRPISLPTTGTCSASSPDREATPLEVRSTTWPRAR